MEAKKSYSYLLTIYEQGGLKFRGSINYETDSNAPSEERKALEKLLSKYPLYLRMYGSPKVTPDMFKGYMHLGRRAGYYDKYRLVVDLNRSANSLPVNVFVDVEKRVN